MRVLLSREEALSCVVALEKIAKPCGWEKSALAKLLRAMGLKPQPVQVLNCSKGNLKGG